MNLLYLDDIVVRANELYVCKYARAKGATGKCTDACPFNECLLIDSSPLKEDKYNQIREAYKGGMIKARLKEYYHVSDDTLMKILGKVY